MSLSRSALALVIGRMTHAVVLIATAMLLSRLLSRIHYGMYQQVWLVYRTMAPFLILGLPASITYFIPHLDRGGQKTLVVQSTLVLLLAGVVVSVATLVLSDSLGAGLQSPQLPELLRAFFWFPIFSFPLFFIDTFLVATRQAKAAAWVSALFAVLQFAAVVPPVAAGLGLRTVVYCMSASACVRFVVMAAILLRHYRGVPLAWDFGLLVRQFRYCLPLGLAGVFGKLTLQLDHIMVSWFFGPGLYSVYVNGSRKLPFVNVISGAIMAVVAAEFVRLYRDGKLAEMRRLWHSATLKVAVVFLPLAVFLMLYSSDAMMVLYSKRYLKSASVFRVFVLLLPIQVTQYGALLMAAGRSMVILRAFVAALTLNAVLNCLLIPVLALPGAAIATVVSAYAVNAWQLHKCALVLEVGWGRVFPWHGLARLLLASLMAGAAAYAATFHLSPCSLRLGIALGVFTAAGVPLLWFVGGAGEHVKELVGRLRAKTAPPPPPAEP